MKKIVLVLVVSVVVLAIMGCKENSVSFDVDLPSTGSPLASVLVEQRGANGIYWIKPGDTLSEICEMFGVDIEVVLKDNGYIVERGRIYAYNQIFIRRAVKNLEKLEPLLLISSTDFQIGKYYQVFSMNKKGGLELNEERGILIAKNDEYLFLQYFENEAFEIFYDKIATRPYENGVNSPFMVRMTRW